MMASVPPVFFESSMALVMHRLYVTVSSTARLVGDIGFDEFLLLVSVQEREGGLTTAHIKSGFPCSSDPAHFVDRLVAKELVERFRTPHDRRMLSVRATAKGRNRLRLVDQAMTLALVESCGLTEPVVEYLAGRMHDYVLACDDRARLVTVFPSAALTLIQCYHRAVVNAASRFGMTAAQALAICLLHDSTVAYSSEAERVLRAAGILGSVPMLLEDDLIDKELLNHEMPPRLTEKGSQRAEDVRRLIDGSLASSLASIPLKAEPQLEALGDHFRYLFS